MHLYYSNLKDLEIGFNEYIGGQLQTKTMDWMFRGEIKGCMAINRTRIKISFNWLCERHFYFDNFGILQPKWSLLVAPPGLHHLDLELKYFYTQPDENRMKVKGKLGEICHLFPKDDHTNLVQCGDKFVPYCNLHKLEIIRAILVLNELNCG